MHGGRWNWAGVPMVYTSESVALAALETFVGMEIASHAARIEWTLLGIDIPDSPPPMRFEERSLPKGWNQYPRLEITQDMGSAWARNGKSLALMVPSSVIPREKNILLNPNHQGMAKVIVAVKETFLFDGRLMGKPTGQQY